ncbi:MAG: protein arginine kinase [Papillibacter sp.]|nr:protein arginine kinase [Papillibacter sp.]
MNKWYEGGGIMDDIVISSRIRLARNLSEYPFPARLTASAAQEILDKVSGFLTEGERGSEFELIDLSKTDGLHIGSLMERHLISRELASKGGSRGVVLSKDESISIMINEEDHLRLQVLGSGLCLNQCRATADKLDDLLEANFSYAWDDNLGYLTHCPTNLGTGLRASVMLHLPAHTETGEIKLLITMLGKLGFAVRGLYGEGTAAAGAMYQISNQLTLGPNEQETIERLEQVVKSTIERERALRAKMVEENPTYLSDKIWRAYGILKYARRLSASEAMELLSVLREGVSIGEIQDVEISLLNRLIWSIQPSQLCLDVGRPLTELERDTARATMIREKI